MTDEWGKPLPSPSPSHSYPFPYPPGIFHNVLTHKYTDASKTPPSRFQKRKGSIYATPSSRDGHVERNRDAVEEFHKAHSKRWSLSSVGSSRRGSVGHHTSSSSSKDNSSPEQQRKASQ
ncbi:hypothetical protein F4677DRAFT_401914 [Hypoxylon crocopeplum]|nr:hypothetical protein F4677DRAFT_401914 [Hypoxylon crocopeplum]